MCAEMKLYNVYMQHLVRNTQTSFQQWSLISTRMYQAAKGGERARNVCRWQNAEC